MASGSTTTPWPACELPAAAEGLRQSGGSPVVALLGVIPKEISDAAASKHREWSHCAICARVISGPSIAHEGGRYVHLGCVDWEAREYPGRELRRRLRGLRRRLEELVVALDAAERVAERIERGWPAHARARAEAYFRLLDRVRAAIYRATGGW